MKNPHEVREAKKGWKSNAKKEKQKKQKIYQGRPIFFFRSFGSSPRGSLVPESKYCTRTTDLVLRCIFCTSPRRPRRTLYYFIPGIVLAAAERGRQGAKRGKKSMQKTLLCSCWPPDVESSDFFKLLQSTDRISAGQVIADESIFVRCVVVVVVYKKKQCQYTKGVCTSLALVGSSTTTIQWNSSDIIVRLKKWSPYKDEGREKKCLFSF